MTNVIVILLTLLPVLLGARRGYRAGLGRLAHGGVLWLVAWGISGLVAAALFLNRVFEPLGLMTPAVAGWAVLGLLGLGVRARIRRRANLAAPVSLQSRSIGAILGGLAGALLAAALWCVLVPGMALLACPKPAAERTLSSDPPQDTFQAMFRTANRGFVRHLPLVGSLGDEVEALDTVLRADPGELTALTEELGWQELTDLESFKAILEDSSLLEDITRGADGDMLALYRLQQSPRIIAFWNEKAVGQKAGQLRPSDLVQRLETLRARARLRER